jgi:spore coat polysaccharide biosynthesis protein SpsF
MRVLVGIQARTGSTRLPGKIYEKIGEISMLEMVYQTCKTFLPDGSCLAVVGPRGDDTLKEFCKAKQLNLLLGPEEDVTTRYGMALKQSGMEALVRVTSDCPLIPGHVIEKVIHELQGHDYVTNVSPRTFLDGEDCQGIKSEAMDWIDEYQTEERQHPFKLLDESCEFLKAFTCAGYTVRKILSPHKLILNPFLLDNKISVDTAEDLERVRKVYEANRSKMA